MICLFRRTFAQITVLETDTGFHTVIYNWISGYLTEIYGTEHKENIVHRSF